MFTAIQAASLSLSQFLQQRFLSDVRLRAFFNPAFGGTMVISLNSPQEMTDLSLQGLSVWLYQVVRDEERLNLLPERIAPNLYRRPPLPVRLHYLMTPMVNVQNASSPETEQMILGKVLQVFNDHPRLSGSNLRGDLTGSDAELNVRLESLSLEQVSQVFFSLERSLQLAVSYEVAVVYIESELEPEDAPPVLVAMPRYGIEVDEG